MADYTDHDLYSILRQLCLALRLPLPDVTIGVLDRTVFEAYKLVRAKLNLEQLPEVGGITPVDRFESDHPLVRATAWALVALRLQENGHPQAESAFRDAVSNYRRLIDEIVSTPLAPPEGSG